MRLNEERRINENEKCVGRGEGKKRGGVCYGGDGMVTVITITI